MEDSRQKEVCGQEAIMNDLLKQVEHAGDIDELSKMLSLLSRSISHYCEVRRINVQMFQEASKCLIRMRLVLNDLEREEVLSKGACRGLADRYVQVESEIRKVSCKLLDAMRQQMQ